MHATSALAVVVVCHDSAEAVGATLQALTAQLRPGDELVIVDNASRDGTRDVVRAGAQRVEAPRRGHGVGVEQKDQWSAR